MAAGRIPEGEAPFFTQVADTPRPRVQVQQPFPEKPETPAPRISLQPPFPEKPEPPAAGPSLADSTWPKSPLTAEFRDTIAGLESQSMGNYQAFNPEEGGIGALGRYQMRSKGLIDAGMLEKDGEEFKWTGEHGIDSAEAFLNDPLVQERVFATHVDKVKEFLRNKGATSHVGQEIEGIEGKITITMNGLIGAAHREGAGGTNQYLTHLEKHGWKSDPDTFPENKRDMFLRVETRLRLLQDVPLLKDPAP